MLIWYYSTVEVTSYTRAYRAKGGKLGYSPADVNHAKNKGYSIRAGTTYSPEFVSPDRTPKSRVVQRHKKTLYKSKNYCPAYDEDQ